MARRDNGSGSIYRDHARGDWRGEVKIDGKRYVRRGKTRAVVVDRLNALQRDYARGVLAVDQTTTVSQMAAEYVSRVVPNRKGGELSESHRYTYRWAAQIIDTHLGRKRVAKLTTRDVETMLDALAATGRSRSSITKVRNVLRLMLDYSIRRGELARNVASVAELPAQIKPKRERMSLSVEMARQLLDGLDAYRNGAMFAASMFLGLRPGEAAGLYWDDIDMETGIVNVTRSRQTGDRGRVEISDDLKTARAKRTLEMPPRLCRMLEAHRKQQAEERLAAPTWVNSQLVFATASGTPLNISSVRKQLATICAELGVTIDSPEGSRVPLPYELRHTAASLYSAAGIAHEQIADLFGLTTPRMIDEHYRHRLHPTVNVARVADWSS